MSWNEGSLANSFANFTLSERFQASILCFQTDLRVPATPPDVNLLKTGLLDCAVAVPNRSRSSI